MKKLHVWLAAMLLAVCGAAMADYPDRMLKLIVPWPPGGGVDTAGRLLAQGLTQELKQTVVVENHAGAGGNLGTEMAARLPADGYNLLMGSLSPNAVNPYLYTRLGFDPRKDFIPVTLFSSVPNILVVPADSPFKTLKDVLDFARANPDKLNYGSGGVGSSQHLSAVQFMAATNIKMTHVPYKGTAPAEADLVAGHISLMIDTTTCLPFIRAGKLRALAVAAKKRNDQLPDTPTLEELGVPVSVTTWYGLMVPAGTPKEVVDTLSKASNRALESPAIRDRLRDLGANVGGGTPEQFAQFVEEELKRYESIVELSGAKLD